MKAMPVAGGSLALMLGANNVVLGAMHNSWTLLDGLVYGAGAVLIAQERRGVGVGLAVYSLVAVIAAWFLWGVGTATVPLIVVATLLALSEVVVLPQKAPTAPPVVVVPPPAAVSSHSPQPYTPVQPMRLAPVTVVYTPHSPRATWTPSHCRCGAEFEPADRFCCNCGRPR